MIPLLESPAAQRLAWTLLHFLWQGALLGLAAWATFALLRHRRPQLRYLVGCAFLLACLGSAILTYGLLAPPLQAAGQPMNLATVAPGVLDTPTGPIALPEAAVSGAALPWHARLQPYLPWILAAWAAGVLILSLRAAGGWLWLRRLKAAATPMTEPEWLERLVRNAGLRRAVRFLESARVLTPMCMGLLRPVVLLPLGFFANLDPLAAEAVLAHELAHIKRLDGLVNGLQCVIEVLFFFHPAVWWISRRIRTEREHCCDDAAVLACGDAVFYAETLSRLDEFRDRPPSLALRARGGNLMERLRRLLLADPPQLRFATPSLLLAAALALVSSLPAQAEKLETVLTRIEEIVSHQPVAAPMPAEIPHDPFASNPGVIPSFGSITLPGTAGPAGTLPIAQEPVMTPSSTPASAESGPGLTQPPVKETFYPTPTQAHPAPMAIPMVDAESLSILPGMRVRTFQAPPCPVLIKVTSPRWSTKGFAVQVPGRSLARATLRSESSVAYLQVRALNKWGAPLEGSRQGLGTPEASFLNTSDASTIVCFVVSANPGYPGDGKIEILLTTAPWSPAATPSPESQSAPVQGSAPKAAPALAPASIPVFQARDLDIVPGLAIRTLKVPQYPAVIVDELLTWPNKGYAVDVPGHTTVSLRITCESGEAYFRVGVADKWGNPLRGMKGSMGTPWASFANDSEQPVSVIFFVRTTKGYPGNGKIRVHVAAALAPRVAAPRAPETGSSQGAAGKPSLEEAHQLVQRLAERTSWGATSNVLILKIGEATRWNGAFTDHFPKKEEERKAPVIQGIPDLEGWEITFRPEPIDEQKASSSPRSSYTVLVDKDRVIHWRTAYPWQRPNETLPEVNRVNQFGARPSPPPPPPPPRP
ncbi:M56 family metallopeptidase [Geothrix sp.]|jgi:beta-lactamase regulating signal transducer with metallopeptidase domain|uniref:M56 family metallopeptidase n=1 Tax=Geothrix sp. TaxID=1962974 RepID=UPI0025BFEF1A|nr:M56 family metallopeptidase [Geothrix sp.]